MLGNMSSIQVSIIIFVCIFGSALLGMWLSGVLPENHLNANTKDLVKLGVGLVGTMAAMLLGLLVASAKGSYDTRRAELTQLSANVVLLDRALAHYGPEAGEIRQMLKITTARMIDQIWSTNGGPLPSQAGGEVLFDRLQQLVPKSEEQRSIQAQAESIMMNTAQTRWLLFAQSGSAISTPFLVVGRLLAQHAVRQLRLVRAAQRDGNRYSLDCGNLRRRRVVSNPGTRSSVCRSHTNCRYASAQCAFGTWKLARSPH